MVKLKKGHNLVNISQNSLKSLSGHLNSDLKPYAKYENPSSSRSHVVVLTRFLWPRHNFAIQGLTEKKICVRLLFVLMLHIKFQVPSSSRSLVLQPTTMLYWLSRKRGITQSIFHGIRSKNNQVIYTLIVSHIPNIRILAQEVLKISC